MNDIIIIFRDIHGRVYSYDFDCADTALDFICCELEDSYGELEILFVKHDGCCVYSALGSDKPLCFEDLIGYLC